LVDIDTHRVIDLLNSREFDAVAEWLKTYPNIEIVSRDGSVSYNSAIKHANEDIVQISDRFHLLKGLTDASKKYITGLVTANFGVPTSASHYDGIVSTDYWAKETKDDFPTREHTANCEKKIALANKARELKEQGYKLGRIVEEIGISYSTAKRYLSPDFNPVHGLYNTTMNSKVKPYADAIKEMLGKGKTFKEIEAVIREDGYDGAASTIRMFTTRERKLLKEAKNEDGPVEKIERKWLISLLYKPVDRVKEITQVQLDKVIEKYPVIGSIYDAVQSFKQTLFSKKQEELEKWMSEVEKMNIAEINSFINGIRRDLDAVKKAIEMDYNNGLAEGSVNKLKVVKRIMFGRNSFELLKSKLLRLELKRQIN
jgi:predicted transcriptional regulator